MKNETIIRQEIIEEFRKSLEIVCKKPIGEIFEVNMNVIFFESFINYAVSKVIKELKK